MIHLLPLPPQQNMQPPIAKTRFLLRQLDQLLP
jgi:hypothetical protein